MSYTLLHETTILFSIDCTYKEDEKVCMKTARNRIVCKNYKGEVKIFEFCNEHTQKFKGDEL